MKTEIIVKKEYPFCPVKVGEKLELKGKRYVTSKMDVTIANECFEISNGTYVESLATLEQIKQDAILMQFLEIKESKSIEDYVKETYNRIRATTELLRCYPLDQIREKHIMEFNSLTQRFFNSELLRTIADDLNEGWQPDFYNTNQPKHSLYYYFKEKKYGITKSIVTFDLNVVYFKSEAIAQQVIELMGEERLNTLR